MRPGPAYQSKILKKKQLERELELHYLKLNTIKSVTDYHEPSSLRFPLLKSKKRTIEEGKYHKF